MQLFSGFTQQIESGASGALDQVSEVDLSDEHDVRATITGCRAPARSVAPVGDPPAGRSPTRRCWCISATAILPRKYQTLIENIGAVARDGRPRRIGRSAIQPRGGGECGHATGASPHVRDSGA